MSRGWNNWSEKNRAAEFARKHTEKMGTRFSDEIAERVKESRVYSRHCPEEDGVIFTDPFHIASYVQGSRNTFVGIEDMDSVSAIFKYGMDPRYQLAALNFASYKEPGGRFLDGSLAQEESLCRESYLYNVLRELPDYYAYNNRHKEQALYGNRAVFTPDVRFIRGIKEKECGVITCAAPNKRAAKEYCGVSDSDNTCALRGRIRFILDIACTEHVDTLVAGAFGCGVFGQDPKEVAECFFYYLSGEFAGIFRSVIFAVPKKRSSVNYDAFVDVARRFGLV